MPAAKPKEPRRTNTALDLAELGGHEWEGFAIISGLLHHPYWRRPFTAAELLAQFYELQQLAALRHSVQRLSVELERAEAALEVAENLATWYRRQLVLESRAGLMLASLHT